MKSLTASQNNYSINNIYKWSPSGSVEEKTLEKVFEFAYEMSFGAGEHRDHRSGGSHRRKAGEIFINAFQGKISEFALYFTALNKGIHLNEPDLGVWASGIWDSADAIYGTKKLNIKSTKHYGNLLLLETKDWNSDAEYIPNTLNSKDCCYDFFVLVRVKPDGESLMRKNSLLYSESVDKELLKKIILNEKWEFDIPGFISKEELKNVISSKQIIPRGAFLNGKTKMDADNYYIQTGDLNRIESLFSNLLED